MSDIFNMADTWTAVGTTYTAIKMNVIDTASAAGSNLLDLQIATVSLFNVDKLGAVSIAAMGSSAAPSIQIGTEANTGIYASSGTILDITAGGTQTARFSTNGWFVPATGTRIALSSDGALKWSSGTAGVAGEDTGLKRTGAAIVGVTDGSTGYGTLDTLALRASGTKVVGAQGAAVADASGGSVVDAEGRTALNALLARLRTHGLIAT